jgi:SOS-response transcriptional repressor LexA
LHNKLTEKQKLVLSTISHYIETHGYAPSFREVGEILNLTSSATIYSHMEKLKEKGYITWEPAQPRTLRILKTASQIMRRFNFYRYLPISESFLSICSWLDNVDSLVAVSTPR